MARRTLSQEVVDGILNGLRNGVSPAALATKFGVSVPTVYNYRKTLNTQTVETNAGNPDVSQSAFATPETTTTAATVVGRVYKNARRSR